MRNAITALAAGVATLGLANFFTHTIPVYVSHPLAILAIGFLVLRRVAPAVLLRPVDPPPPHTGAPLASARCSGGIGRARFQNTMKVTAYADRLVVRVLLVGTRTIMADQLVTVREQGAPGWPALRIEHAAGGLSSPVTLVLATAHPLRQAIERLWRALPAPAEASPPAPARSPKPLAQVLTIVLLVGAVVFTGVGILLVVNGSMFGWAFVGISVVNVVQVIRGR